jgi:hypothetical protein
MGLHSLPRRRGSLALGRYGKRMHFVVMLNVFYRSEQIHERCVPILSHPKVPLTACLRRHAAVSHAQCARARPPARPLPLPCVGGIWCERVLHAEGQGGRHEPGPASAGTT